MNLLDGDHTHDETNLRAELEAKWADKSEAEVRKAKVESDLYIKTLEKRLDDLRPDYLNMQEELQSRASLQELRDQIAELQKLSSNNPPASEVAPELNLTDIDTRVSKAIAKDKQTERETQNYTFVKNKLVEKYGNNYQSYLSEQMDELGLTPEKLNERARTEPRLLIKALGLDAAPVRETFQAPPQSNLRNDSFAPKGKTQRNYAYYQELKKSDPKIYLNPKIAVQMHDDAVAQGEAFYA